MKKINLKKFDKERNENDTIVKVSVGTLRKMQKYLTTMNTDYTKNLNELLKEEIDWQLDNLKIEKRY